MKEKVDKRVLGYYRKLEAKETTPWRHTEISYKKLKRRYMEELGSYVTEEE